MHYKKAPMMGSYYDVLVNKEVRCEVKVAKLRGLKGHVNPYWMFNICRHGKRNPNPLELYAMYCVIEGGHGIWLFVPWEELRGKYTQGVSLRSMAMKWGKWIDRYELFSKKPIDSREVAG